MKFAENRGRGWGIFAKYVCFICMFMYSIAPPPPFSPPPPPVYKYSLPQLYFASNVYMINSKNILYFVTSDCEADYRSYLEPFSVGISLLTLGLAGFVDLVSVVYTLNIIFSVNRLLSLLT